MVELGQPLRAALEDRIQGFDEELAWTLASGMGAVALILVAAAFIQAFLVWNGTLRPCRKTLHDLVGKADLHEARSAFAEHFDEVDDCLSGAGKRRHPGLATAWLEFKESLVELKADGPAVPLRQNTVRPDVFYDGAVPRYRWLGTWANLFVGIGLLFTFVGLIAALKEFSGGLASGADMTAPLSKFIGIAAAKFITSIAGVACSLLLKAAEQVLGGAVGGRTRDLCQLLERGLRYAPPQALADQTLTEAREQTRQLKLMGESIASQLEDRMRDVAGSMSESLEGIRTAVETTGREQADGIRSAVTTSITENTGAEMKRLADVLDEVPKVLSGLDAKLEAAGGSAAAQIDGAAATLREGLAGLPEMVAEAARSGAEGISTAGEETTEALSRLITQLEEQSRAAQAAVREESRAAMNGLREDVAGFTGAVKSSADETSAGMRETQAAAHEALVATLARLGDELSERGRTASEAEASRAAARDEEMKAALRDVSEALAATAQRLEDGLSGLPEALKRATETGAADLAAAASSARQGAEETARLAREAAEARDREADERAAALGERMSAAMTKAAEQVADGATAFAALNGVAERFSGATEKATTDMATLADRMGTGADALDEATRVLSERIEETTKAMTASVATLRETAGSLSSTAGATKEIGTVMGSAADRTAATWEDYRTRFAQVDEALGKTVRHLTEEYVRFADRVSQAMGTMDSSLARNVGALQEATDELANEVGELRSAQLTAATPTANGIPAE